MSYSKTVIVGRVGRDAEQRFTPAGKAVTQFSVAVNTGRGENKKTTWFEVVAWERLAEICGQYVKKGNMVLCDGQIELNQYQGNDGQQKASLRLTARDVVFLPSREEAHQQTGDFVGAPDDEEPVIPF